MTNGSLKPMSSLLRVVVMIDIVVTVNIVTIDIVVTVDIVTTDVVTIDIVMIVIVTVDIAVMIDMSRLSLSRWVSPSIWLSKLCLPAAPILIDFTHTLQYAK